MRIVGNYLCQPQIQNFERITLRNFTISADNTAGIDLNGDLILIQNLQQFIKLPALQHAFRVGKQNPIPSQFKLKKNVYH